MARNNPYAFKSRKMEQQFQTLRKQFKLTRKEFEEYYKDIRRANKKGQNLKRYGNALYRPHYSTEVTGIKTRAEFTARVKSVKTVLSADFRKLKNTELRTRFYANLSYTYGAEAQSLINMFMTLTDSEIISFLQANKDLEIAYYDSDLQAVAMYLETIGMSLSAWYQRLNKQL